jgi:hypothetical protein
MAYHQNMNPSSLETQMGAILEPMENLPDSCKAA